MRKIQDVKNQHLECGVKMKDGGTGSKAEKNKAQTCTAWQKPELIVLRFFWLTFWVTPSSLDLIFTSTIILG